MVGLGSYLLFKKLYFVLLKPVVTLIRSGTAKILIQMGSSRISLGLMYVGNQGMRNVS